MKKLSEVVNVVPVIAKADTLTIEEREAFKDKVGGLSLSEAFNTNTLLDRRSEKNLYTTTSVCILSTRTRMTRRRLR